MTLLILVLLPILTGLLQYIQPKSWPNRWVLWIEVLLLGLTVNLLRGPVADLHLTAHPLPIGMRLQASPLTLHFVLLTNVLFPLLLLFASGESYFQRRFVFLFMSLQGLIVGVFVSADLFNIYLLMEVATVVASILIMYKKDSMSIYDGLIYLVSNMVAMTFFLMGIGYMYKLTGILDLFLLADYTPHLTGTDLALPAAFLLTGVSLKAAMLPLFSWLPKAHGTASAPSVVSAVLSAIFVKTGIYLYIRIGDMLHLGSDMSWLFLAIGIITALAGVGLAMSQRDLKLFLAYSTVSQVGLIMAGINTPGAYGFNGAMVHIYSHGLYKGLLFLLAGLLVNHYSTRDMEDMQGLWHRSKFLSLALFIGGVNMIGFPLTLSSLSKDLISKGMAGSPFEWIFFAVGCLSVIYLYRFVKIILPPRSKGPAGPVAPFLVTLKEGFVVTAFILILLGAYGWSPYLASYMGFQVVPLSLGTSLAKFPVLALQMLLGFLIFYLVETKSHWLSRVRKFDLSFNGISLAIVTFFAGLVLYFQ